MDAIRQQTRRTVQSTTRQDRELGIGILMNMVRAGEIIAPWWSKHRDRQLRDFVPSSDHFQSATWMIGAKLSNVPFKVQPRDRGVKSHQKLADQYQTICQNMLQFGQGWSEFWTRFYADLWSTDNGAFAEVLGGGRPGGKLKGPAVGLAHLDSLQCNRTSNPEFPVVYQDFDGKRYKFHHTRVIYKSQLPDAGAQMFGVGHCWLSRAINNVQQLVDQDVYFQEALGSRPLRQFLIGKGIDTDELIEAVQMSEESMDNQGLRRYAKTAFLGDPNRTDIGIDSVPFSFLPDGYDKQQQTSIAMFVIALAGGFPPRWLWPATAAGATKADAMFQHISGVGGGAQWHLNMMRDLLSYSSISGNVPGMLPPKFLPKELKLTFDFQDDEQDRQQAEIQDRRATTRKTDIETGVVTIRVAREQALADGDLTPAQFAQMELEEGRLVDGDDVLTLFDSTDALVIEMLDLGVEEPLLVDANDAIDMIIAIESQALEAQRRMVQAGSKAEREKSRQVLEALGKLKGVYEEIVGKEIEEQVAAEQAAGTFELPETQAAPTGEGESAEAAAPETKSVRSVVTQEQAGYKRSEHPDVFCGACERILPCNDGSGFHECAIVSGEIQQSFMCDYFERKRFPYSKGRNVKARVRQRIQNNFDWAVEFVVTDILDDATKETTTSDYEKHIDDYLYCLRDSGDYTKAFKFGARMGERIRGGLFRGRGGKFASEGDISAIKSEILGRLIARLRGARAAGGKGGAAKKPKKGGGGGGSGAATPDPEKLAQKKLAAERKARAETFGAMENIDTAQMEQLVDFIGGGELDPAAAQALAQQGFVRFDDAGNAVTTAAGRSIISAATKGDTRRAADVASKAREQVAKVQARADKKREQAATARERADDLTGRSEVANADADELDDDADELLAQANAEEDEKKAGKLRDKAAKAQERAEKKRAQAADLQERATEQQERATTLDADAVDIEATIGAGERAEVELAQPEPTTPAPTRRQPSPQAPREQPEQRQPTQEDQDLLTSLADSLNTARPDQLNQLIEAGLVDLGDIPGQVAPRLTSAGEDALKKKELAHKSLAEFELGLTAAVTGLWNDTLTTLTFLFAMRLVLGRALTEAWEKGAADCGIKPGEMTDVERSALSSFINSQMTWAVGFAADINTNDQASGHDLEPLLVRMQLWLLRYNEARERGKAMACADKKLKWILGKAEHCPSCIKLAGKVRRASWWNDTGTLPRVAGADYLECHGFNCQCKLVRTDDAMSRGAMPSLP